MYKKILVFLSTIALGLGIFSFGAGSVSADSPYEIHGPNYQTYSGSELLDGGSTLVNRCASAAEDTYGSILTSHEYTCEWHQRIDRRVSSVNGSIVDVSITSMSPL